MNRQKYYNNIEEKLNTLTYRIEHRAKGNILDLNIHSETFFAELCNIIFDLELVNINLEKQNTQGIDLIDRKNKIIVQVSSTYTKAKIENSLSKKLNEEYSDYNYKFLSISKNDTSSLKTQSFKNPYKVTFNPKTDIWDIAYILKTISMENDIDKIKNINDFIENELSEQNIDYMKVESNLTKIINILAQENLKLNVESPQVNAFEIEEKININALQDIKDIINTYKIFSNKLDNIYTEFDKEGNNKSLSILQELNKQYIKLRNAEKSSTQIFSDISDAVYNIIISSKNYTNTPREELSMYIDIVLVDAFLRCKIFKNPAEVLDVTT